MQTNQRPFNSQDVCARATKRVPIVAIRFQVCRLYFFVTASLGLVAIAGWKTVVVADQPERINRLGRVLGQGYSDGYHACESTGRRLLADLPAKSYSHRVDVTKNATVRQPQQHTSGFATYYDHFDHACNSQTSCDARDPREQSITVPQVTPDPVLPEPDSTSSPIDEPVMRQAQESITPNNLELQGILKNDSTLDPAAQAQRELDERARELESQRQILAEQERYRQFQVFEKLRQNKTPSETNDLAPTNEPAPTDTEASANDLAPPNDLESTDPVEPIKESTQVEVPKPAEIETEKKEDSRSANSSNLQDLSVFGGPPVHQNPYAIPASQLAPAVTLQPNVSAEQLPQIQGTKTQSDHGAGTAVAAPVQPDPRQSSSITQPTQEDSTIPSEEPEQRVASREWLIIRQPK